ncbi:hypothetical protein NUW58_g6033 [Xylaria curta]|uniref:Uncharacterized protein n=1 Tax=Xylaria curta TaxID=42375 RepID=A0ACC1P008_9PEZI|nr:hypothetical protein NUW58_g6033 [Xylaria curta]
MSLPTLYYPTPCEVSADCEDCEVGFYHRELQVTDEYYVYQSQLEVNEACDVISRHLASIKEARDVLTKTLDTHADLFMSRWKKYSQAKREKVLQAIAPDIAPHPWHIFDYQNFSPHDPAENFRNPKTRHQLLLPWLDLETLKSHPQVLSLCCITEHNVHPKHGLFRYAVPCVIVHGLQYGGFLPWNQDDANRADILGFPKAELLFEAQAYLMTTLQKLVSRVLEGVREGTPAQTSKWRELTHRSNFKRTNEIELWSPYIFPAFSAPHTLDLRRLTSLASARLRVIKDHLWQLQCSPAYMHRHVKLFMEINGPIQTRRLAGRDVTYQALFLVEYYIKEIHNYFIWKWVEEECKRAEGLQVRFRDNIYPGQPVPQEYAEAIRRLIAILGGALVNMKSCLRLAIIYANPNVEGVADTYVADGQTAFDSIFTLPGSWDCDNPLLWCLMRMGGRHNMAHLLYDDAVLLSFFQHHLSSSAFQKKAGINEFLSLWVDNLSEFSEILSSVCSGRPKPEDVDLKEVIKTYRRDEWCLLSHNPDLFAFRDTEGIGDMLTNDLYKAQPPTGPRDVEWLQCSRKLRAIMADFWLAIHRVMTTLLENKGFSTSKAQQMLEIITVTRSAEYQREISAEEAKILADIEEQKKAQEASSHLPETQKGQTKRKTRGKPTKQKTKTRPKASDQADVVYPEEVTESQNDTLKSNPAPAPVRTTKRALHAIKLMFPETPQETSGTIQWGEFLNAMSDMGFVARNLGGSGVSFEAEGQGRIVFHRPHPGPRISPVMLQMIGARMNRWFAWTRESFVLDED